jgi:hypothetical protein
MGIKIFRVPVKTFSKRERFVILLFVERELGGKEPRGQIIGSLRNFFKLARASLSAPFVA